jgi:hypothetical protein
MSDALARIEALQAQRAQLNSDIDREIEGLKAQALVDLEAMRSQVSKYEAALNVKLPPREQRAPARATRSEIDETDAGNGIRETNDNMSADDFRDELAELRERTQAKRRRLG